MSWRQLPGVHVLKHPRQGEDVADLKMEGIVSDYRGDVAGNRDLSRLNAASKADGRRRH